MADTAGAATGIATAMGLTSVTALSYLVFNLYTPPCFAAIGAMNSEMQNKKWLWGGICLQLGTAYVASFFITHIGSLITIGELGSSVPAFIAGLIAVAALIGIVVYLMINGDKKIDEYKIK